MTTILEPGHLTPYRTSSADSLDTVYMWWTYISEQDFPTRRLPGFIRPDIWFAVELTK